MAGSNDEEAAIPVAFDSAKVNVFGNVEEQTNLWVSGCVVDHPDIHFVAKVYDVGSGYGLADGRISKLSVYDMRDDNRVLFEYDRGWPENDLGVPKVPTPGREQEILQAIVEGFPEPPRPQMEDSGQDHEYYPEQEEPEL